MCLGARLFYERNFSNVSVSVFDCFKLFSQMWKHKR